MINIDLLCKAFEEALGWPYVLGGTSEKGIDCSGMFVRAYRLQKAKIAHGSNTIYRSYCTDKGQLNSVNQLRRGYAVFKWNPNTPGKFKDGLGDFQHIGLVVSVNPLRIIHASTVGMIVKEDTSLSRWKYWGKLKNVGYDSDGVVPVPVSAVTTPTQPTLRKGDKGTAVMALQALLKAAGHSLTVDGDFGPATKAAVLAYQKSKKLAQDGVVGAKTWAALLEG